MVAFFRINDPYRLVLVLIVLIGIRMPFLIEEIVPTLPQFRWMLIGERLADGSMLYRDLYDNIAPFSAWVFQAMVFLFGRNIFASALIAIFLVFLQSVIFNNLLLANKTHSEGTYLPAYCYAIFMSVHFDFLVLSPALMSITFILLALRNIFKRIDNQTRDELFMSTGIYLGVATLFYLPTVVIFFVFLIILIIYSNSLLRRLLLMTVGYLLVLLLITGFYYILGLLPQFSTFFLNSLWSFERVNYFSGWRVMAFIAFPILLVSIAWLMIYLRGKFANFQLKFQQAMLLLLLGSVILIFLASELAYFSWIFIIPTVAFFTVHLLLLVKQRFYVECINIFILVSIFLLSSYSYNWSREKETNYFVEKEAPVILKGRKIAVLGDNLSMYQSSGSTTPFLNWRVCKRFFVDLEYYDNLVNILKGFENDPPEMILDEAGVMPEVYEKIPVLKRRYLPVPNYPGYYRKTAN